MPVVLLGTRDTKGVELQLVRTLVQEQRQPQFGGAPGNLGHARQHDIPRCQGLISGFKSASV